MFKRLRVSTNPLILLTLSGLVLLTLYSCTGRKSPEKEIRNTIAAAEKAVENGRPRLVRALIAEDYNDQHGRNRQDLVAMVTYHVLKQQTIHLLTYINALEFGDKDTAEVELLVAMSGLPLKLEDLVANTQADVYQFSFILAKIDGEWLLTKADWRPASLADFIDQQQKAH